MCSLWADGSQRSLLLGRLGVIGCKIVVFEYKKLDPSLWMEEFIQGGISEAFGLGWCLCNTQVGRYQAVCILTWEKGTILRDLGASELNVQIDNFVRHITSLTWTRTGIQLWMFLKLVWLITRIIWGLRINAYHQVLPLNNPTQWIWGE